MRTLSLFSAAAFGFAIALVALAYAQSADAYRGQGARTGIGFAQNVTRTVESIDDGVIITMTSDDAETVAMLQDKEFPTPRNEDVTKIVENIDNGVRITITSDDPEYVEHLQAMQNGETRHGMGKRGKHGFATGCAGMGRRAAASPVAE